MPRAQGKHGQHNQHALQRDEQALVADQLARVPLVELVAAVRAAGQDEQDGGAQGGEEDLHAQPEGGGEAGAEVAHHVVAEEAAKDDDDGHLQGKAGKSEVDAELRGAGRRGGEGAAGGLEAEAEEIGGDEDVVEEFGAHARERGGEVFDAEGGGRGGLAVFPSPTRSPGARGGR